MDNSFFKKTTNYLFTVIRHTLLTSMILVLIIYVLDDLINIHKIKRVLRTGSSTPAIIEDKQDYIYVNGDDELRKYFDFKDLNIFRNTELFTVTGKLKNNDTYTWDRISLHMEYYVDDIHIGSCYRRSINIIKPGESKLFKINCRFIDPLKLPDGFSYRLIFDSAKRLLN